MMVTRIAEIKFSILSPGAFYERTELEGRKAAIVRSHDNILQIPWRNFACSVSVDQEMRFIWHPSAF